MFIPCISNRVIVPKIPEQRCCLLRQVFLAVFMAENTQSFLCFMGVSSHKHLKEIPIIMHDVGLRAVAV